MFSRSSIRFGPKAASFIRKWTTTSKYSFLIFRRGYTHHSLEVFLEGKLLRETQLSCDFLDGKVGLRQEVLRLSDGISCNPFHGFLAGVGADQSRKMPYRKMRLSGVAGDRVALRIMKPQRLHKADEDLFGP